MREHYDHSELVLADMWGGVRGALPPLLPAIRNRLASANQALGRTTDQQFLREGRLPPGCWVGCDGRRMLRMA